MSGRAAAVLLLALILGAAPADAQRRSRGDGGLFQGPLAAGPRVGRDFKNKAWLVGGQLSVPLSRNLELRPSGDLVFPSGEGMGWQLNGDAALRLGQGGGLFIGGGIALVHPDDADTETGYNLFFGLSTAAPDAPSKPFLEFRWTDVGDTRPFRLMAGINYTL